MKIAAFSIADYCEATEGMPHDVERLYFRMIMKMLSRESGLPDSDDENARMFGYRDVRTYKGLKAKLMKWPETLFVEDGLLKNERVEKDLADYKNRKAAAVKNGRIGGRSKRDQPEIGARSPGDRPEIGPRSSPELGSIPHTTPSEINDLPQASPSPSPISISEVKEVTPSSVPPEPKPKSPRGARLQPDWELPVEWAQWARVNCAHSSDAMVAAEAEKFRDYWISKAGQQAAKLDWQATWRNWCRTAFAAKPSANPVNIGRMSWDEQRAAKHEATRKMMRDLGMPLETVQ